MTCKQCEALEARVRALEETVFKLTPEQMDIGFENDGI